MRGRVTAYGWIYCPATGFVAPPLRFGNSLSSSSVAVLGNLTPTDITSTHTADAEALLAKQEEHRQRKERRAKKRAKKQAALDGIFGEFGRVYVWLLCCCFGLAC